MIGVYIHIPFCQVRCGYCDFNTYAGISHLIDGYVAALCQEIRQARGEAGAIYFGGGTPSLLSPQNLQRILDNCSQAFSIAPGAEITVEANPGTLTDEALRAYRGPGANRLSLGVQSFDDAMLHLLDRLHNADEARAAYWAARSAGFDNISLDFMYGLPGQTLEHWQQTLEQAIALRPEHLSLYALTLEDRTPMARQVAAGRMSLPDDDRVADMYDVAQDMLDAAGYRHYEISNWSMNQATEAQHNSIYWRRQPYLGFGAGAHSFDGERRFSNILHPRRYIERLQAGESAEVESEAITPSMALAEEMFLGLRLLLEGVDEQRLIERYGQSAVALMPQIDDLVSSGLLERHDRRLLLTCRGRLLSNQVFIRFL